MPNGLVLAVPATTPTDRPVFLNRRSSLGDSTVVERAVRPLEAFDVSMTALSYSYVREKSTAGRFLDPA